MLSYYEAALLAKAAYDETGEFPALWERSHFFQNDNGLSISVFHRHDKQKTVISFRGTKVLADLISDAQILLQWPLDTAQQARNFYDEHKETFYEDTVFVGHSLGGALAASMSLDYGVPAIIFDSPGFYEHAKRKAYFSRHEELIHSVMGQPNFVNTCHEHVGTLFFVNTSSYHGMLGHGIDIIRNNAHHMLSEDNSAYLKMAADSADGILSGHSTLYLHKMLNFVAYFENSDNPVFRIEKWPDWVPYALNPRDIPALIRQYKIHESPIYPQLSTQQRGENKMFPKKAAKKHKEAKLAVSDKKMPIIEEPGDLLVEEMEIAERKTPSSPARRLVTDEVTHEQQMQTLKSYATSNFLGFGFDRTRYDSSQRSVSFVQHSSLLDAEDSYEANVRIEAPRDIQAQTIGYTQTETLHELATSYGLSFLAFAPRFSVDASLKKTSATTEKSQTAQFVCSFVHYQERRCHIASPTRDRVKKSGDAFVKSGVLFVGYQVHMAIQLTKNEDENSEALIGELNARFSNIVSLSVGGENSQRTLRGKSVASISIIVEAEGYTPSSSMIKVSDVAQARQRLQSIDEEFCQKLPGLREYSIYIDPKQDLIEYYQLPAPKEDELPEEFISSVYQEIEENTLDALAERIKKRVLPDDEGTINAISFSILFSKMPQIMGSTIQETRKVTEDKQSVVIVGPTGAGKSTLLGYQLGELLERKSGSRNLDYKKEKCLFDRPKIGHRGSETKGSFVYESRKSPYVFIDSAGTLDTEFSPETDICNAIALSTMIRNKRPTAIILVVSSADTRHRCGAFLALLDRLKRVLSGGEDMWSSVLFVINDIGSQVSENRDGVKTYFRQGIETAISIFEDECKKLLPRSRVFQTFWQSLKTLVGAKKISLSEEVQNELRHLDNDKMHRIEEYFERINMLNAILEEDNFVAADLLGDNTESQIFDLLDDPERVPLHSEKMTPELLYEDRISDIPFKFKTILRYLVSYFNEMQRDFLSTEKKLKIKERELEKIVSVLRKLNEDGGLAALDMSDSASDEIQQKIDAAIADIQTKKNEINALKTDETAESLTTLHSSKQIEDRTFWSYFNWMATTYPFDYNAADYGDAPYLSISPRFSIEPSRGEFTEPENTGTRYKTTYRPGYYGTEYNDSKVGLSVKVKRKDHPSTKERIASIEREIEVLRSLIGINEREQPLNPATGFYKEKEDAEIRHRALIHAEQRNILEARETKRRQLNNQKIAVERELDTLGIQKNGLERILSEYTSFCMLIADIIKIQKLHEKSVLVDREQFSLFLRHFDLPKKMTIHSELTEWYDDEAVNRLLRYYFPLSRKNLRVLDALVLEGDISHELIQARLTSGFVNRIHVYYLPLRINTNHWIGLYVDRTPGNPKIWWLDPYGGGTLEQKDVIIQLLNRTGLFDVELTLAHVSFQEYPLQNDGYNCGPWVIEMLRFIREHGAFLAAKSINIEERRREHRRILDEATAQESILTSSIKENMHFLFASGYRFSLQSRPEDRFNGRIEINIEEAGNSFTREALNETRDTVSNRVLTSSASAQIERSRNPWRVRGDAGFIDRIQQELREESTYENEQVCRIS